HVKCQKPKRMKKMDSVKFEIIDTRITDYWGLKWNPMEIVRDFLQNQKIIYFNTDGIAALDAIERKIKVQDKKVLLIGAGGVAKAIANEAVKRKANLIILNRDQTRAFDLASKLQCRAYSLDKISDVMREGYDVIINATSASRQEINLVPPEYLIPGTIVMDVVSKPVETAFLKHAQDKGCLIIYGMEMFINQAKRQFV
ncbi:hypothetical protein LCGC14_2687710, partial [marine sediment metagenome]